MLHNTDYANSDFDAPVSYNLERTSIIFVIIAFTRFVKILAIGMWMSWNNHFLHDLFRPILKNAYAQNFALFEETFFLCRYQVIL